MSDLIRIGERLFNLAHVTSIEPADEKGPDEMNVYLLPGRCVRLRGDEARAARFFVSAFPPEPVDQAARDRAEAEGAAAQDQFVRDVEALSNRVDETRG